MIIFMIVDNHRILKKRCLDYDYLNFHQKNYVYVCARLLEEVLNSNMSGPTAISNLTCNSYCSPYLE